MLTCSVPGAEGGQFLLAPFHPPEPAPTGKLTTFPARIPVGALYYHSTRTALASCTGVEIST
jgi:hypothetical protein